MSLRSPSNTRFAWPLTYRGPSGVAPTPQAPWTQRREAWLALIVPTELGGKGTRFELGRQGSRVQAEERELRRLVDEGLIVPASKPRTQGSGLDLE